MKDECSRYHRQEKVVGASVQERWKVSSVIIIGMGAIGTVVASLLARAGIGKLVLVDQDIVEESNLPRQILFGEADLGKSKAECAKEKLHLINSQVDLVAETAYLQGKNIKLLDEHKPNLVIDSTDNLKTRFLINDYCKKEDLPWIYGSAIATRGQVMIIYPEGPCLSCFITETSLETCMQVGVLNTITALVGSWQADLALKFLGGILPPSELIAINCNKTEFRKIKIHKKLNCPRCNNQLFYLTRKEEVPYIKFCSSGRYLVSGQPLNLGLLQSKLGTNSSLSPNGATLKFKNLLAFTNGQVLIEAVSEKDAQQAYSKYIGN